MKEDIGEITLNLRPEMVEHESVTEENFKSFMGFLDDNMINILQSLDVMWALGEAFSVSEGIDSSNKTLSDLEEIE